MGWMLGLMLLMAAQAGPDEDGPQVTATQVQECVMGGQPVACPPASEHPPVRQPTAEEIAEKADREARVEAYMQAWLAERANAEPDWKTDSQGWVTYQCREVSEAADLAQCQSDARNRLVHLRAAQIDARPIADPSQSSTTCRWVLRPNDDGTGSAMARVCGDAAVAISMPDDVERSTSRQTRSCDGPASGESNDAWISRCPPGGGGRRD